MRVFILFFFILLNSLPAHANEKLFDVPTVNQFFVKAYFESETDKESGFWIGTATARCVAAAELAETMNRGLEELAGDARNGYMGNLDPDTWKELARRAYEVSIIGLTHSGQTDEEAAESTRTLITMGRELYHAQLAVFDDEGYPGWSMLRADLADCRRFFTQDLETNPYNPKEPERAE